MDPDLNKVRVEESITDPVKDPSKDSEKSSPEDSPKKPLGSIRQLIKKNKAQILKLFSISF